MTLPHQVPQVQPQSQRAEIPQVETQVVHLVAQPAQQVDQQQVDPLLLAIKVQVTLMRKTIKA